MDWSWEKREGIPLYNQIQEFLSEKIDSGELKAGDRLPPVSEMGRLLNVTAATIRRALVDLVASGLVESHVGRGTFISSGSVPESSSSPLSRIETSTLPESHSAARKLRTGISRSLHELMQLSSRPGIIAMNRGIPDLKALEPGLFSRLVEQALSRGEELYMGYGDSKGLPALREIIAERYRSRGVELSADHILITSGSQQAVALMAHETMDSGLRILCETPGYRGVPNAFSSFGHWVETVTRDSEGPLPDELERFRDGRSNLLYLCPVLQNPMGTDLSASRRKALIDWANKTDTLFLVDEIFADLRFDGDKGSPDSLIKDLGEDRTVLISSLSKSFLTGLRVGWLVASPARVRSLSVLKKAMDLTCPPLMQGIALALFQSGEYDRHLERVRQHYRVRSQAALSALEKHMPKGVTWTAPAGGFQMWCELPEGYSSVALYLKALDKGAAFSPGPLQDVNHRCMNGFRLCYGGVDPDIIESAVEKIGQAADELLREPPGEAGLSGFGEFYG